MGYLGHIFDGNGMHPDPCKVSSVREWPTPTNATTLKQFLGLASYYRRYIEKFADIATPLHNLSKKDVPFAWTSECNNAFSELKDKLTHASILSFRQFTPDAPPFSLQADATTVGLGAVLATSRCHYCRIRSCVRTRRSCYCKCESHLDTIREAIQYYSKRVFGSCLCHEAVSPLLIRPSISTDDRPCPLQWLSAQKMEGLLCWWALAMEEYNFEIVYRKGTLNTNADAL